MKIWKIKCRFKFYFIKSDKFCQCFWKEQNNQVGRYIYISLPVNIIFDGERKGIVDDVIDVRYVKASGCNVGRDE